MMLNWEREIQQKPKLRTYIIIKSVFGTEDYLKLPYISRSEKSLLAQLRLGTLPLRIETGRFRGEDIGLRLCLFCTMNVVEHEQHFICECDAYGVVEKYYTLLLTHNIRYLTCYVNTINSIFCWCIVGKQLQNLLEKRDQNLYNFV